MRLRCTRLRHARLAHPAVPTGRAQGSAELLAPEPSRRNRRKASGQAQAGQVEGAEPRTPGMGEAARPSGPGPPRTVPLAAAGPRGRLTENEGRAGPGGPRRGGQAAPSRLGHAARDATACVTASPVASAAGG